MRATSCGSFSEHRGLRDGFRRLHEDLREFLGVRTAVVQVEHLGAARRAVHQVHDVVEPRREPVDVLAVERRDEALVDPVHDLVRDHVGLVLEDLDLRREHLEPVRLVEQFVEHLRRPDHDRRERVEHVEEAFVFWNEPHGRVASGAGAAPSVGERKVTALVHGCRKRG